MLTFRAALEPDVGRLVDIHAAAFPDSRGEAARARNFVDNSLGTLDDLQIAEVAGVPVAHAFLFSLTMWFGGRALPASGIASVGVAPEARGRGVGRALVEHLHALANARGDVFTLLYGFRQGFYTRLGYAAAAPSKRLSFCPGALRRPHVAPASVAVRAASGADRPGIEALYQRAVARSQGRVERPVALWNTWFSDERRHWFVTGEGEELSGFVSFALEQPEAHAKVTMVLRDLVAASADARRALLAFLAGMRDQVTEIEFEVAEDDAFDRGLVDADSARFGTDRVEHPIGTLVGGPLLRLLDVDRALSQRGYARDGTVVLDVEGVGPALALHVQRGRGSVERAAVGASEAARPAPGAPTVSTSTAAPTLRVGRAALGAVLYGGLRVRAAADLGLVSGTSEAIAVGDDIFALPSPFNPDAF